MKATVAILAIPMFSVAAAQVVAEDPCLRRSSPGAESPGLRHPMNVVCPPEVPTRKDKDEAQRQRARIPKERWNKMTDAEKADAAKNVEPPKRTMPSAKPE